MWKLLPLLPFVLVTIAGPVLAGGEAARIAAVTRPTTAFARSEPYELRPAGAATSFKLVNRDAFSHPSANMSFERELDFKVGNGVFRKIWVSAPASTASSDGLGPLFNARACQHCHLKDGRGRPPAADENAGSSLLLRLSIPPRSEADRAALASFRQPIIPEPTYGAQLQDLAIQGIGAEGELDIRYEEIPVTLADGTVVSLRKPIYEIAEVSGPPLHPEVMMSPRIAQPMIGLGLLEAIDEADILAHADPEDRDGDGISGKPNWAWSAAHGRVMIGRFGWKAGEPTIRQQTAHAFNSDMGLAAEAAASPSGDCTAVQAACRMAPSGADPETGLEVAPDMMDLVVFYARNLAVPARRDIDDRQVLAGKRLFYDSGCIACHTPKYVTRRDGIEPEQSFQLIWPYTDLLLHDMGEGLADLRPGGNADGREWRTAPLWGIGLTETVSGHTHFLHDGRARSLLEAILWHGGEADAAKQRVVAMPKTDREALLAFLKSL